MATILKKDKELKEVEVAMEQRAGKEKDLRVEYLQNLRKDPLFQQFVIEEIFDKEIETLTDIRSIPIDGEPEKIVSLLATAKAARVKLEMIRAKLVT